MRSGVGVYGHNIFFHSLDVVRRFLKNVGCSIYFLAMDFVVVVVGCNCFLLAGVGFHYFVAIISLSRRWQ